VYQIVWVCVWGGQVRRQEGEDEFQRLVLRFSSDLATCKTEMSSQHDSGLFQDVCGTHPGCNDIVLEKIETMPHWWAPPLWYISEINRL
jgi:hypothetical protein